MGCRGITQFCSTEWEELGAGSQKSDSEEVNSSALEACLIALSDREGWNQDTEAPPLKELCEEGAEGLHQLADKLPPPGKALLDVLLLGEDEEPPAPSDFLSVMGALRHMISWHGAKVTLLTSDAKGWQRVASLLGASLRPLEALECCIDEAELWRGGLQVTQEKAVQYFSPVLDLVRLVTVSELPAFLLSSSRFTLALPGSSAKSRLLLEQLRSLGGKVGALFCLSCVVSFVTHPPASQLSSQRWRDFLARRPRSLPVPDVEVKGENGHYFLLVQGSEGGVCCARMIHSASQINGAAAMATVTGILREKSLSLSGRNAANSLRPLPCLDGEELLKRERRVTRVQTLALEECLTAVPLTELQGLLRLAREQYLKMYDSRLRTAAPYLLEDQGNTQVSGLRHRSLSQPADWLERSVLQNLETRKRKRQKKKLGVLSEPGSADSLLGPKDSQKVSSSLLDAKELLRHFTPDGMPTGELQPLVLLRSSNVFLMSADLSPRKVTQLSFSQASASHYHGLQFCLDRQQALDKDRDFARLQSRLIRYETQTTCSKEPLPFALSPAPSPAVMSEPGSVPDGETLQNAGMSRLKRGSWETDVTGGVARKSGSQGSSGSGAHPSVRSLRQQPIRSQSPSSHAPRRNVNPLAAEASRSQTQNANESRSQKHHRMLMEVVSRTLNHHGIPPGHTSFPACSQRLFEISKFYLQDLKTSRGLHDEMKKAASSNAKQVIEWVLERAAKT
ncbi:mdm2-binding protein [Aplochiton taeniatus]